MGTSLTTPNNSLRYPAGLVGEAPDPPDDIGKLAIDVDNRFGVRADLSSSLSYKNGASSADPARTFIERDGTHVNLIFNLVAGSSGFVTNTEVLALPDNCRPRFQLYFTAWIYTTSWIGPALFTIDGAGGVYPNSLPSGAATGGATAGGFVQYRTAS